MKIAKKARRERCIVSRCEIAKKATCCAVRLLRSTSIITSDSFQMKDSYTRAARVLVRTHWLSLIVTNNLLILY